MTTSPTFTIDQSGDASRVVAQMRPDKADFRVLAAGLMQTGVLSGCAVTPSSGMTIAVASGTIVTNGTQVAYAGGTVAVPAAHATLPRKDLVYLTSAGVLTVGQGTAGSVPVLPTVIGSTPGAVALAAVYVPATDTTIGAEQITDKRAYIRAGLPAPTAGAQVLTPNSGLSAWIETRWNAHVQSFGADPTGATDSAAGFRAAADYIEANSGKGVVYAPYGQWDFDTTTTLSVDGTNRDVGFYLRDKIVLVGDGMGSGRSGGDATGSGNANTQINATTAMWAAILAYSSTPDWRPVGIRDIHVKDNSTSHNVADYGIMVKGHNNPWLQRVSISHFQKTGAYGFAVQMADAGQAAQYGRWIIGDIWACDNGIHMDGTGTTEGGTPDWFIQDVHIQRHDGATPVAGRRGVFIEDSNKVTLADMAIQFYSFGIDADGITANKARHLSFRNLHIEAHQSAANDSYESAVRIRSQSSSTDHLPLIEGIDIGNSGKYLQWLSLQNIDGARINNFRIRDQKWLETSDTKFSAISSAGTVDGTAF